MENICVLQSSDALTYVRMFDITNRTAREFCHRNNLRAEFYVGLKRGTRNWHASYNRIIMIKELLDRGFDGWIIWLDADAYIADLNFDIVGYLRSIGSKSLVVTQSGSTLHDWDINNGVFMLNLGSHFGRVIAYSWYSSLFTISDDEFSNALEWYSIPDDQTMLQWQLQVRNDLSLHVHFEENTLINSTYASFIRQVMRVHGESFDDRCTKSEAGVNEVLSSQKNLL